MLTIREAASLIPCTEYALRKALRGGRFPFVIIGGKYLLEAGALEDVLRREAEGNQQKARERGA